MKQEVQGCLPDRRERQMLTPRRGQRRRESEGGCFDPAEGGRREMMLETYHGAAAKGIPPPTNNFLGL
ncbi:hypothetical protein TNCV_1514221 [Trichonephila clavipes]|nr:hypothetical protein TNCV_1514221 [Trichonephila clavipes]